MAARRLHHLIYVTIANCGLFLIVCAISLGTNWWFTSQSNGKITDVGEITARFGLFNGVKTKESIAQVRKRYDLKLVCKGMKCMFSCGTSATNRTDDISRLLNDMDDRDFCYCAEVKDVCTETELPRGEGLSENRGIFLNFGLYLATVAFLALGMIFAIVSGMLALYNTYRTPVQPMLSASGLYFWNGIAGGFVVLTMIMWLTAFMSGLRKNAAISDTISGTYDSSGMGALGVSFWILFLPVSFAVANIVILKYRAWKIVKMEEKNVRVMKNEDENGETILF